MKSKSVRLDKYQMEIIITMCESQIRICDPELLKRTDQSQREADAYKIQLERLRFKLLRALSNLED